MWVYVIACLGVGCPWGDYYDHSSAGWDTKAACEDAAGFKIEEFATRYGLNTHTFFFACANRGKYLDHI